MTYQGESVNRIVRLNSDGSRDSSFNIGTGFDSGVSIIAIQSDGNLLVGGQFMNYQGQGANRIARLNSDGSRDTSFNIGTGFTGIGYTTIDTASIQSDGKVIVGGNFTTYQGNPAGYLIRLQ